MTLAITNVPKWRVRAEGFVHVLAHCDCIKFVEGRVVLEDVIECVPEGSGRRGPTPKVTPTPPDRPPSIQIGSDIAPFWTTTRLLV